jgi:hypothetical protein
MPASAAKHFLAADIAAETSCVITDLQMPGLNGLELQEELRSKGYKTPPRAASVGVFHQSTSVFPSSPQRWNDVPRGTMDFAPAPKGIQTVLA